MGFSDHISTDLSGIASTDDTWQDGYHTDHDTGQKTAVKVLAIYGSAEDPDEWKGGVAEVAELWLLVSQVPRPSPHDLVEITSTGVTWQIVNPSTGSDYVWRVVAVKNLRPKQ